MTKNSGIRFGAGGLPAVDIKGVIPGGSTFHGEIDFGGGLWIDGNVRGDLRGREGEQPVVVVNHQASVKGHLLADHIVIHGTVTGNVDARQTLILGPTAKVRGGHIRYGELSIAEGATVSGQLHCHHSAPAQPAAVEEEAAPRLARVRSRA